MQPQIIVKHVVMEPLVLEITTMDITSSKTKIYFEPLSCNMN
jgi:hypothetical protein